LHGQQHSQHLSQNTHKWQKCGFVQEHTHWQ
jgi:hypothetical protein